jgi:hypothetical protein
LEHFLNGFGDFPNDFPDDDAKAGGLSEKLQWAGGYGKENIGGGGKKERNKREGLKAPSLKTFPLIISPGFCL